MRLVSKFKNLSLESKASISYTICSVLQKSLSFITLPLFTRLLTTTEYGQYSVYSSWMIVFSVFITLNLPYGSFSKAMIKFENERDNYISTVNNIVVVIALLFVAAYLTINCVIQDILGLPTIIVVVMVLQIITDNFIQCWYGKNRFEFKYKRVIVLTLLNSIFAPLLAVIFIFMFEEKGYARIVGYALVTIVSGLALYVINITKTKRPFSKECLKYALKFNIPLLPYYISQVIFNQSDRIMIDYMCGTDKAGIYSVAYSLAIILTFVLNAINNAYVPWMYKKFVDGDVKANKSLSAYISILIAFLSLIIIWFAPEIIFIMSGEQYMEAVLVVPPVAISLLLLFFSQLFINIEFYYEEKWRLVVASFGAALVNIVLNYLLIPKFGYVIAGYTTLISYILFALANYFSIRRHVKRNAEMEGVFNLKVLILIFVVLCFLSAIVSFLYDFLWIRLLVAGLVLLVILIFNRKIKSIITHLKSIF